MVVSLPQTALPAAFAIFQDSKVSSESQEAVGPFSSWVNVVTTYGADPTGATDSTIAIQTAFNSLSNTSNPPVLYFPNGTYVISCTVFLVGGQGVSVVGQSTAGVIFKFVGPVPAGSSSISAPTGSLTDSNGNVFTWGSSAGGGNYAVLVNGSSSNGQAGTVMYKPTGGVVTLLNSSSIYLSWAGTGWANANTLLRYNGCVLSRIDKITFDAASSVPFKTPVWLNAPGNPFTQEAVDSSSNPVGTILVDESADGSITSTTTYFPTGCQFSDCVFQNGGIGLLFGNSATGSSEASILRCRFNNVAYGTLLMNPNSLDIWHWGCTFQNSPLTGIANVLYGLGNGGGAYSSYWGLFQNNFYADWDLLNTGIFNLRNNLSVSTAIHGIEYYYYTNAANTRLSNNTIVAINEMGNLGPWVSTDNNYINNPPVSFFSEFAPDYLSVGDTSPAPFYVNGGQGSANRNITQNAVTATPATPTITPYPFLPNNNRTVFNVSAGASAATIQAAINSAAALNGQRPIVHLNYGSYNLGSTGLTIPVCDLQLTGDGPYSPSSSGSGATGTNISYSGSGAAITLQGPGNHATLREFSVSPGSAGGVLIQQADQVGARIWSQQINASNCTQANIYVNALNNALVEFHDLAIAAGSVYGVQVVGGAAPAAGKTYIATGDGNASAAAFTVFNVSAGGTLIVRDFWWESTGTSTTLWGNATGASTLVADGCHVYLGGNHNTDPTFTFTSFSGKALIICCSIFNANAGLDAPTNATIDAASTGNVWQVGNNFATTSNTITNNGSGLAYQNLNRLNNSGTSGSVVINDTPGQPSSTFVTQMLAACRATQSTMVVNQLAAGVTDVRIYRVSITQGSYGLEITA